MDNASQIHVFSTSAYDLLLRRCTSLLSTNIIPIPDQDSTSFFSRDSPLHVVHRSLTQAPAQLQLADPDTLHAWLAVLMRYKEDGRQILGLWLQLMIVTVRYTPTVVLVVQGTEIAEKMLRVWNQQIHNYNQNQADLVSDDPDDDVGDMVLNKVIMVVVALVLRSTELAAFHPGIKKPVSSLVSVIATSLLKARPDGAGSNVGLVSSTTVVAFLVAVLECCPVVLRQTYNEWLHLMWSYVDQGIQDVWYGYRYRNRYGYVNQNEWAEVIVMLPRVYGTQNAWMGIYDQVTSRIRNIVRYTKFWMTRNNTYQAQPTDHHHGSSSTMELPSIAFSNTASLLPSNHIQSPSEFLKRLGRSFDMSCAILTKLFGRNYFTHVRISPREVMTPFLEILEFYSFDQLTSIAFDDRQVIDTADWLWFIQQLVRMAYHVILRLADILAEIIAPLSYDIYKPLLRFLSHKNSSQGVILVQRRWVYDALASLFATIGPTDTIVLPFLESLYVDLHAALHIEKMRAVVSSDSGAFSWSHPRDAGGGSKRKRKRWEPHDRLDKDAVRATTTTGATAIPFSDACMDHLHTAHAGIDTLSVLVQCDTIEFQKAVVAIKNRLELLLIDCILLHQDRHDVHMESVTASAAKALGLCLWVGNGKMTCTWNFDLGLNALHMGLTQSHRVRECCAEALNLCEAICHPRSRPVMQESQHTRLPPASEDLTRASSLLLRPPSRWTPMPPLKPTEPAAREPEREPDQMEPPTTKKKIIPEKIDSSPSSKLVDTGDKMKNNLRTKNSEAAWKHVVRKSVLEINASTTFQGERNPTSLDTQEIFMSKKQKPSEATEMVNVPPKSSPASAKAKTEMETLVKEATGDDHHDDDNNNKSNQFHAEESSESSTMNSEKARALAETIDFDLSSDHNDSSS